MKFIKLSKHVPFPGIWVIVSTWLLGLSSILSAAPNKQVQSRPIDSLEVQVWAAEADDLAELESKILHNLRVNPRSAFDHYLLAHLLAREFNENPLDEQPLLQASELAQQAVDLAPNNEYGYLAVAELLDLMNEPVKGLSVLEKAQQAGVPMTWRFHLAKARLLSDKLPANQILALLDTTLSMPNAVPSLVIPYVVSVLQGSYQGDKLQRQISYWNDRHPNTLLQHALAESLVDSEKFAAAHEIYMNIYNAEPWNKEAKINDAALLYRHLNQPRKARTLLEQVINDPTNQLTNQTDAVVHVHLGAIDLLNDDLALAKHEFIRALKLGNNREMVLEFIRETYHDHNNLVAFAEFLRQVNHDIPGMAISYGLLAETLTNDLHNHEGALTEYSNAILLEPDHSEYYNGMGLTYYRLNKMADALKLFAQASHVDPNDASARYNQACVLARLNRTPEALLALREAFNLDPRLQETAKTDADFKNLQSNKQFNDLISSPAHPLSSTNTAHVNIVGH